METGGRAHCGVCAALDVHYLSTGGARAAAVLAADAAFAHVLAERSAVIPRAAPYRPGEFYRRQIRAMLAHEATRSGCLGLRSPKSPQPSGSAALCAALGVTDHIP